MNNCTFIGNVGKDPVLKQHVNSDPSCNFSIGVRGNKKDSTVWVNVTTWGKLAERCSEYLSKGKKVAVTGAIELRTWENYEQNKHGASLELTAKSVEFLSPLSTEDAPF